MKDKQYGTDCPHHSYIVRSLETMQGRVNVLEQEAAQSKAETKAFVDLFCEKVACLTSAIEKLVQTNQDKFEEIDQLKIDQATMAVTVAGSKKFNDRITGFILGIASTSILGLLSWIIKTVLGGDSMG